MKSTPFEAVERLDAESTDDQLQVVLHRQRYDFTLNRLLKEDKVLEIGTGAGVFSKVLANYCREYVGIEFDSGACKKTRGRLAGKGTVLQGDAQQLPFEDQSFSAMVCLEVLEHLPDFRKAIKEIHRCLEPVGRVIISVPYRKSGGTDPRNPYHLYEPGEAETTAEFAKYFALVKPSYQYFAETSWMTLARVCHLRRFVGLVQPYRALSEGAPEALEKLKIGEHSGGMNITLMLELAGRRAASR